MLLLDHSELKSRIPTDEIRSGWEDSFFGSADAVAKIVARSVATKASSIFIRQLNSGYPQFPNKENPFVHRAEISPESVSQTLLKTNASVKLLSPYQEWAEAFDRKESIDNSYFLDLLSTLTGEVADRVPGKLARNFEKKKLDDIKFKLEIRKLSDSFQIQTHLWVRNVKKIPNQKITIRLNWNQQFRDNLDLTAVQIYSALVVDLQENLRSRQEDPYLLHPTKSSSWYIDLDFDSALKSISDMIPEEDRLEPFKEWTLLSKKVRKAGIDSNFFTDRFITLFKKVNTSFISTNKNLKKRGTIIQTKLVTSWSVPFFQITFYMTKCG